MWFLILCLIFIFFYYIFPSIAKWFVGYMIRRQTRKFTDRAYRAAGIDPEEMRRKQKEEQQRHRQGGWSAPTPRRRKIDPRVGEYVKFKEVAVETESDTATSDTATSGSSSGSSTGAKETYTFEEETQIIDVKWEDIE